MKVFKFGGGVIKDATAVRKLAEIVKAEDDRQLVVVVSAMDKITNALEKLVEAYFFNHEDTDEHLRSISEYHREITAELFPSRNHPAHHDIERLLDALRNYLQTPPVPKYDYEYDQIICYGELLSTSIVSQLLKDAGIENELLDARLLIRTNSHYREAAVDWEETANLVSRQLLPFFASGGEKKQVVLTQGFIGSSNSNHSTSLGREGSDFTAAIFAHILNASQVVVWKDVPGVLNADPRYFEDAVKMDCLSYREALELSYYGAKVIHPKTIKPLQNKKIPLIVKSFYDPAGSGTLISEDEGKDGTVPSIIVKSRQVLLTLSPNDFSFIAVDNLHLIFGILGKFNVNLNLMQNSALSFSICITETPLLEEIIKTMQEHFSVRINKGLHLVTVRRYNDELISKATAGKELLLVAKSRTTAQMVVREGTP